MYLLHFYIFAFGPCIEEMRVESWQMKLERINKRTDEQKNERKKEQEKEKADKHERTSKRTKERTKAQTDKQTNRQRNKEEGLSVSQNETLLTPMLSSKWMKRHLLPIMLVSNLI